MSGMPPTDALILEALKSNFAHARHIEQQRLQALAIYVAVTLGLGYGAIFAAIPAVRILATELGFCLTLAFWGLAAKQNAAFKRLIAYATRCSELLAIDGYSNVRDLVDLTGFPRRLSGPLRQVTARLMFHVIYATFAINWLLLLGYSLLRLFIPEANL